ncbi:MAG: methionyl-tRNA formyltransferase [Chloroflexi bacterium]|nr:methionyl-tRNA formyltransferase [Chloroflexota bacterium]
MRIVFFGSPTEAADSLGSLIAAGHEVAAAYSQPDRKSGRGQTVTATPVKMFATQNDIPVFTPKTLRNNEEELKRLSMFQADVFVVVSYGRILPQEILQIPPIGVVNIHPSLLPLYRGPSPVVTAILDGQGSVGVTVMLLDEGMDTGPVLAQSKPVQLTGRERGAQLQDFLFREGALMLPEVLQRLQDGSLIPQLQDHSKATGTRLIERSDGEIDWSATAEQIDRMVRAYDPWPGTFTSWNGKGLKILDVVISNEATIGAGVVAINENRLLVGAGALTIELKLIQLEGRQVVAAADFLRGYPGIDGATLGL